MYINRLPEGRGSAIFALGRMGYLADTVISTGCTCNLFLVKVFYTISYNVCELQTSGSFPKKVSNFLVLFCAKHCSNTVRPSHVFALISTHCVKFMPLSLPLTAAGSTSWTGWAVSSLTSKFYKAPTTTASQKQPEEKSKGECLHFAIRLAVDLLLNFWRTTKHK